MDLNRLVELFNATLHPEPGMRQTAEQQLQQLESHDGFLGVLLQMLTSADLPAGTKQAASIYFKNRVRRSWQGTQRSLEQYAPISAGDRTVTKKNILGAIIASPQAIKLQLTECLGIILKFDFPDKWPEFTVHLKELLHSQDAQHVYTGLLALLELIKRYRYSATRREVIDEMAKELFPQVQKIAEEAVASDSELAMRMAWLSFKSYLNTIQTGLPLTFQNPESLVAWGTSFIKMIEKPVPFDKETIDEDAAKVPVWKAKKWAMRSINRLYGRYGNQALLPSGNAKKFKNFAKLFTSDFMPQIMRVYLQQIEGYTSGNTWLSLRMRGLVAQFLSDCVKDKTAWKLLKPHTEAIVAHFIFPLLCFSRSDQELWEDNPVEYVQKRIDPLDDFGSATVSVSNLLIDLAFDRKKATLGSILGFINGVLGTYAQATEDTRDPRAKDGALTMMSALCGTLASRKSPVANVLPEFLLTHVVPEFKSNYGFLRARALDTFCRYSNVELPDPQVRLGILEGILGLLNDSDLPVRVHAALALAPLIADDDMRSALTAHLPQVMQVFLNLTNEIDSDTVTNVIEEFVEAFADRMAPFAEQLGKQLCDTFMRVMGDVMANAPDGDTSIEDMSDKTMAAMGVLKTLGTLVLNLEGTPEVVYKLEKEIFPIAQFVLKNQVVDLYDEVFEILDYCLFSVKAVSSNAWELFGAIHACFKSDGIDFIEEMLPTLDNYVAYGMDVVAGSSDVQARLFDIIETVLKSDRVGESERICACKLAEAIMLHGRGQVDGMIPGLISLAAAYLLSENAIKTQAFRVHALEIVLNALYYNPTITLNVLEQYGWTESIFTQLVETVDKFVRVHDKKLLIVGLSSVLSVPAAQLPPALQGGIGRIFEGVLQTFQTLGKAEESRLALENMYEGDSDISDLDNDFEWDEDADSAAGSDDADDTDNAEYLRGLAGRAADALGDIGSDEAELNSDDDDIEDDDFGDELEEEYGLESPLDRVNPYVHLQDRLGELQSTNTAVYEAITQGLSADSTRLVQSLMEEATRLRNEHINA
ncbi:importin-8 [Coemansia reversa NRRL 1564]|uniref:Importin-8 n=1 Tax=Coemansia reversa (strain ATCC 12441 / NRRL 1564) TaxID=763665 RepID=A0A2G5BIU5_COERN|nr:importin-8 [Coemansia reversa NRRL 1564]|eukprot:PIA18926.1 importin-8 [Coemansia reversa NRRL 1564]